MSLYKDLARGSVVSNVIKLNRAVQGRLQSLMSRFSDDKYAHLPEERHISHCADIIATGWFVTTGERAPTTFGEFVKGVWWHLLAERQVSQEFVRGVHRAAYMAIGNAIETGYAPTGDKLPYETLRRGRTHLPTQVEFELVGGNIFMSITAELLWVAAGEVTYILEEEFSTHLWDIPLPKIEYIDLSLPYATIELVIPERMHPVVSVIRESLGGSPSGLMRRCSVLCTPIKEEWSLCLYGDSNDALERTGTMRWMISPNHILREGAESALEKSMDRWRDRLDCEEAVNAAIGITKFLVNSVLYITHPDADNILGDQSEEYKQWARKQGKKKKKGRKKGKGKSGRGQVAGKKKYFVGYNVIDRHGGPATPSKGVAGGTPKKSHPRKAHQRRCWMLRDRENPSRGKVQVWRPIRGCQVNAGVDHHIMKILTGLR